MWLNQLIQDLRFGLRTFVRTPGFTTLAVLSLALGIMATTAMYSVIHAVILDPFPYKDVDALMSVKVWGPDREGYRTYYNTDEYPRDRRAQHDLRWRHLFDHLRHPLDGRGRPAAAARKLRHAEHLSGHGRSGAHRPFLPARRWACRCRAGGRAGLSLLAASVRRRSHRRRPSAPFERQGTGRSSGSCQSGSCGAAPMSTCRSRSSADAPSKASGMFTFSGG